ncbi:ABC transporter substrate-binding protein [Shimia abyssi]|uniref:Amino acid ABC transporter substrate-binding protein (PAAT family) n=1 Tax=Shimia abyssi TaxID=1662395 RepID=A0A2P8FHG4_9RHOB|nr:ABC transporter substrate-binding protein [Shimia abyssi]PSL21159.1 amino acid ABC transporter substrate-binding protein (PAAT family) [Shimia abyssi]
MRSTQFLTALGLTICTFPGIALADGHCAAGKTLEDGKLTIATGNPAYFPWVMDDAPESGQGFESAVAYAIAAEMGFEADNVVWVRSGFDESIQPGAKNFDFNMQQFSITEDREKVVDFSMPYYSSAMAVLTTQGVVDAGAEANLASLKSLKWGADANTTAVPLLMNLVAPDSDPLLYNDNTDVTAAIQAGQIDAALFDLPTALYLSAVVVENGTLLGQFPADRSENPDQFGALMEEGSPLKACVDEAITVLSESGALQQIEASWLSETTGVPVIK